MKNIRFLILVLVFGVVITSLFLVYKKDKLVAYNNSSDYSSDADFLLRAESRFDENTAGSSEEKRAASKKRKYFKSTRDRNSSGQENIDSKLSENKNKNKSISSNSSNNFSDGSLGLTDELLFSDLIDKEKTSDKSFSTNSQKNLLAFQELLEQLPSRSNDFIVRLDKNIQGMQLDATGREARVSTDLLNSDLFEKGAFSNAAGIWITGLSKYKDPFTYEKLWFDYQNRFIEIPGVGIYFMKEKLSDEDFGRRKIEILSELIEKKPSDKLYEALATTFAKNGDIDAATEAITKWAGNNENVNLDYQLAEAYRINGENTDNNETSQEYLQEAAQYYEQCGVGLKTAFPLAKTYEKLGDINSAIRTLENSYDYGETKQLKDKVAVKVGEYYSEMGDDYSALNSYERSPAPGFVNKVRKAECYQRIGNTQAAIENYKAAIKIKDNGNYIPMLGLGVLYSNNGNKAATRKMYNKINNRLKDFSKKRRNGIKSSTAYQKIKKNVK